MHHQHDQHPISDLAYDWITLIQNKAQALRAYDKYIEDARQANSQACVDLFQRIHDEDKRQLEEAKQHLLMVMNGEMGNQQSSQVVSEQQRAIGDKMSEADMMSMPSGRTGDQPA